MTKLRDKISKEIVQKCENTISTIYIDSLHEKTFPISSNDLLDKNIPSKKTLLAPWLKERELAMVYAAPGIGKTFFALNCAYALANATRFLNFEAQEESKILYVDGEMDEGELQDRWKLITKNKQKNNPIYFYTPSLFPDKIVPKISTDEGRNFYTKKINETDSNIVIFDNLSILADVEENHSHEWSKILTWLIQLKNTGITIILIHHTNKGGKEHRGSSKLMDFLNIVIHLDEVKDEDGNKIKSACFKIKFTKTRSLHGNAVQEIEASLNDDGTWKTKDQATSNREKIIQFYKMDMSTKDIAIELGINIATVYRNIDELQTSGLIKKRSHGNHK